MDYRQILEYATYTDASVSPSHMFLHPLFISLPDVQWPSGRQAFGERVLRSQTSAICTTHWPQLISSSLGLATFIAVKKGDYDIEQVSTI